jgi:hypothetical protein
MVVCPTSHVRCGMTLVHVEPAGTCGGADRPERGLGGCDGGDERLTFNSFLLVGMKWGERYAVFIVMLL